MVKRGLMPPGEHNKVESKKLHKFGTFPKLRAARKAFSKILSCASTAKRSNWQPWDFHDKEKKEIGLPHDVWFSHGVTGEPPLQHPQEQPCLSPKLGCSLRSHFFSLENPTEIQNQGWLHFVFALVAWQFTGKFQSTAKSQG